MTMSGYVEDHRTQNGMAILFLLMCLFPPSSQVSVSPSFTPLDLNIFEGPLVGTSWNSTDLTPLSISKEHFKKICPAPYILRGGRVRAAHGDGASAQKIVETWIAFLADIQDPCVEVPEDSGTIFHPL